MKCPNFDDTELLEHEGVFTNTTKKWMAVVGGNGDSEEEFSVVGSDAQQHQDVSVRQGPQSCDARKEPRRFADLFSVLPLLHVQSLTFERSFFLFAKFV